MTSCKAGHYETADTQVCLPCSTLPLLQAHLGIQIRALNTHYKFYSCTATQNARFDICTAPDNATTVSDAVEFDTDCEFVCNHGFRQTSADRCEQCIVPKYDIRQNALPSNALQVDSNCTWTCAADLNYRNVRVNRALIDFLYSNI